MFLHWVNLKHADKIWGWNEVEWALHDEKNPLFSPKNFEIQNLPLIYLPIYKKIFFSGSTDEKTFLSLGLKNFFFRLMTLKKKFTYILVNRLMANFEFRHFWVKKVDFFGHGAPILPLTVKLPSLKNSKFTKTPKSRRILEYIG